jgi:Tfp pilus assembly protein PilZ
MNILKAKFKNGQAFLNAYQDNFPHDGLFVLTRRIVKLGTSVVVDVQFPELCGSVMVQGIVDWRRTLNRRMKLKAGLGVEFLSFGHRKRNFLLCVAEGKIMNMTKRRHRRLPVEIHVDWRQKLGRDQHAGAVKNIGKGGAFIETTNPQSVGSVIILKIAVPGGEGKILIEAVVTWACEEGMGVEFRCRGLGGSRLLKELIRRIEA